MTRFLLAILLLFITLSLSSQHFTWMKGRDTINKKGYYGTLSVTSTTNNPGGRAGSASWTDNNGNFWLMGGLGYDRIGNAGHLNDLWKYDRIANSWTWINGDDLFIQTGNYGIMGTAAATNKPGARESAATWKDQAGNLWLFGGSGYALSSSLGPMNDLWKYNISTNQWTWIKGSNITSQPGIYGAPGVASATIMPGARYSPVTWTDASGIFWLFGGYGKDVNNTAGWLSDLWKYNPGTDEWTFVSGSTTYNVNGVYGTKGVASATNSPGGRRAASGWVDLNGNFWLFGGVGIDATNTSGIPGYLNDLWKFTSVNGEWTWIHGSDTENQNGIYGSQGVSTSTDTPGGREGAVSWIDAVGNMWLGTGKGYAISGNLTGYMQDLWKYNISTNQWTWIKGGALYNIAGVYNTMGTPSSANVLGCRIGAARWIDASNNLWLFGGTGRGATTYTTEGVLNDVWKYNNCYINPQTLKIISTDSTICAGESTTLVVSGGSNYSWNNNILTNYNIVHPLITTTYIATSTDTNNCTYSAAFTQTVETCVSIEQQQLNSEQQPAVYPNPTTGCFTIKTPGNGHTFVIFNGLGQNVYETVIPENEQQLTVQLSPGVYFYTLYANKIPVGSGKLIVH